MERLGRIMVLAVAGAVIPVASEGQATDVAFCMGCTADSQFEAAAAQGFGAGLVGSRQVLVASPRTGEIRRVTLTRHAPGDVVRIAGISSVSPENAHAVLGGTIQGKVFVPGCHGVTQLSPPSGSAATQKDVERGTLVAFGNGVFGMVLCRSPAFASYTAADQRALSRAIGTARLRWGLERKAAVKIYGRMGADTGAAPAKPLPIPRKVCAIFNNGDSACYVYRSSAAPAKPDGRGAPGTDVAGGSGGVAIVNTGSKIEYGAPGSSGRRGETWLVCGLASGLVTDCVTATK